MTENLEINKGTVEETPDHGIQINVDDPEKTAWEMKRDGTAEVGAKIEVDNSRYQIITPDKLGELKYIFQDIIAGDKSAMERPEFKQLGFDKVKKALEWLAKNNDMTTEMKTQLLTQGWRLNFRAKPPTPEEFLTPKYIGDQANTLHPWIRETFLKFFNPLSPYRNLILSSCIGTGKSTLTVLANMYIALQFAFMWAPYKYYGYAPSTQFTIVFGGFSQKKAYELLMGPLLNVLRQADFWQQCRTMDDMIKANKEFNNTSGIPCIYWTTAAPTAQPLDSKVYLPDGSYKLMGDIKVGDVVMSPTQGEATVINIPFHDVADCYEIELEDGRTVRCSDAHLWKVSWEKDNYGNNIWKVVNTKFLLDHPDYEFEIIDLDDCDSTK